MSPESQEKSEKYLKDLGVKFISNDRVIDYDDDKVYLKSGNIIPSNNVIWYGGKKFEFSNVSLKDADWASFETVVRNNGGNYILGFRYQMGYPDLTIKRWKIR